MAALWDQKSVHIRVIDKKNKYRERQEVKFFFLSLPAYISSHCWLTLQVLQPMQKLQDLLQKVANPVQWRHYFLELVTCRLISSSKGIPPYKFPIKITLRVPSRFKTIKKVTLLITAWPETPSRLEIWSVQPPTWRKTISNDHVVVWLMSM